MWELTQVNFFLFFFSSFTFHLYKREFHGAFFILIFILLLWFLFTCILILLLLFLCCFLLLEAINTVPICFPQTYFCFFFLFKFAYSLSSFIIATLCFHLRINSNHKCQFITFNLVRRVVICFPNERNSA